MQYDWPKKPTKWINDRKLYISIPFTWQLPAVKKEILQQDFQYDSVVIGGPAVQLMPDYLAGLAETKQHMPGVLQRVNPQATRTSIGCPNRCAFCGVKKIHPKYKELKTWPILPVICDDNLLAGSAIHFDKVIDKLKTLDWCDFNQGLDARLLTRYHANRLAELKKPMIRLAWDQANDEPYLLQAIRTLNKRVGIPLGNIRILILIGYKATPETVLARLNTIDNLGVKPCPMRYTPLDSLKKNAYVDYANGWSEYEIQRYMKYWSGYRYFKGIDFDDWDYNEYRRNKANGN